MNWEQAIFTFFQTHRWPNFLAMTVFNFLLEASLAGSALIVLLLLARRFLRRRVGSRMIAACWLAVALRLLLPVALPNPAMNELRPTLSTDAAARPVADQIRVRAKDAIIDLGSSMMDEDEHRVDHEGYSVGHLIFDLGIYTSWGWMGMWALLAWAGVACGVLLFAFIQNLRFRRALQRNRVDTLCEADAAQYEAICERYGVKPVPVYWADPLAVPCLVGVFRPFIALPLTVRRE